MLMLVLLALGRAGVADAGAELEHLPQHVLVGSSPTQRQPARRLANIGAVEAGADALPHIHLFRGAGIGAAEAHLRAIHEVMHRIPERLVHVTLNVGVQSDHLANGHSGLP